MLQRFARILFATFCVTMVAQQSDLGSLLFGDECHDNCPDDTGSHRCPLGCTTCTCVGHGTPMSLALFAPPTVRLGVACVPCDEPKKLPDPHPDTVFHVPRPTIV